LIKFPAVHEHAEVCAIEAVYAECLRQCGITTPDTAYFNLPDGQAAFATRRLTVTNRSVFYAEPGGIYRCKLPDTRCFRLRDFLRATQICTNDVREKRKRSNAWFSTWHLTTAMTIPKFCYLMSAAGKLTLAPVYDVTWCEGPGGYHQMDVLEKRWISKERPRSSLAYRKLELSAEHESL
jgi:serine/threonine-protein kinase HipA